MGSVGWILGAGLAYALTNRWITFMEYDHIGLAGAAAAFPEVAGVSPQSISVRQTVDLVKVGVNYAFDFAALAAVVRN